MAKEIQCIKVAIPEPKAGIAVFPKTYSKPFQVISLATFSKATGSGPPAMFVKKEGVWNPVPNVSVKGF